MSRRRAAGFDRKSLGCSPRSAEPRLSFIVGPAWLFCQQATNWLRPIAKPGPGQIRNSNGPMLAAQVARAGGTAQLLRTARDTVESLREQIAVGLESDVLLLSGGVSAGKLDLVPGVLQELGVQAHFHKVRIKPGKPLFFGTKGSTLIFGLPGNPVSSLICFELFVRPALARLMGDTQAQPAT